MPISGRSTSAHRMRAQAARETRKRPSLQFRFRKFGLVLVVVLVLGAFGFRDCKESDVPELICPVSLIATILEDENDDEHEDDSSNSEFRFS